MDRIGVSKPVGASRGDGRRGQASPGRRRSWGKRWAAVLLCGCLAGLAQPAPAQTAVPNKTYMNKTQIVLPIVVDPRVKGSLREVQLYVKDGPAAAWRLYESAPPGQQEFVYKATRDGEYWFTVVTVDTAGRSNAGDMSQRPPGAVVVVDCAAPQLQLQSFPRSPRGTCIECKVADDHPDPAQTRVEYQTKDYQWRPLEVMPDGANMYCIPHQAVVTGMVKVYAADRCGNVAQRQLHLQDIASSSNYNVAANAPAEPAPAVDGPKAPVQPVDFRPTEQPEGAGPALPPTAESATPRPFPGVQPEGPPVGGGNVTVAHKVASPVRQELTGRSGEIVKNRHLFLNYRIDQLGPTGVGKIEIWVTGDQGRKWERLSEDPDKTSPAEFDLPGEGVYGLRFVATNGRGFGGEPPSAGESPDWTVEVDETSPVCKLQGVEPVKGQRPGEGLRMEILWSAQDKNLVPAPVCLYYSVDPSGPWRTVGTGLPNTGRHEWQVPDEVGGLAYIRMTVADQAGNVTECRTDQPVRLDDMSRPRIRIEGLGAPQAAQRAN